MHSTAQKNCHIPRCKGLPIQNVKLFASNRLILPFDPMWLGQYLTNMSPSERRVYFAFVLFCMFGFPRHQELPPDEPPQGHICYDFLTIIIQCALPQCWEVFLKPDMPCGESLSGFRPILFDLNSSKRYSHIPQICTNIRPCNLHNLILVSLHILGPSWISSLLSGA